MKYRIAIWARWFSRCECVGGLFLRGQQGPANSAARVHSCSANLSHCDCRLALPREHLCGSCCKHRHICTGRSSGGNPAAAIKPLKLNSRQFAPFSVLGATCPVSRQRLPNANSHRFGRKSVKRFLQQTCLSSRQIRSTRSRALMRLSLALLCAAVLFVAIAFRGVRAQGQQTPTTPTIKVTSALVFLDVTVLDKKGHPVVSGLTKDDFTITEDKIPQTIFSFGSARSARDGCQG